ncbi:beta-galactosidase [Ruficoccus amylovorans]|uniref:Beta-galactosidase n=1 Tax=Ruficoccus amylovorans TaxID=1804625 RepID=A0A842HAA7_9BACT|nr:beta-galactosidase [Ruficoccus amylovorans]MBC2593245.1 beta-galactosidase [Ruficoccus amylovorans]
MHDPAPPLPLCSLHWRANEGLPPQAWMDTDTAHLNRTIGKYILCGNASLLADTLPAPEADGERDFLRLPLGTTMAGETLGLCLLQRIPQYFPGAGFYARLTGPDGNDIHAEHSWDAHTPGGYLTAELPVRTCGPLWLTLGLRGRIRLILDDIRVALAPLTAPVSEPVRVALQASATAAAWQPSLDELMGFNTHGYYAEELRWIYERWRIGWVRNGSFVWSAIEPEDGRFEFSRSDHELEAVQRFGLNVIAGVGRTTPWASSDPAERALPSGSLGKAPPRDYERFYRYVRATVERYSRPPWNISHWQIWNEPNSKGYWLGSHEEFIDRVFIPSSRIIREHGGKAVFGGWANLHEDSRSHYLYRDMEDWLGYNELWKHIDILTVHYAETDVFDYLHEHYVRDGRVRQLWMTEFGNTTRTPDYVPRLLPRLLYWLLTHGAEPERYRLFWYDLYRACAGGGHGEPGMHLITGRDGHCGLTYPHGEALDAFYDILGFGPLSPLGSGQSGPVSVCALRAGERRILAVHSTDTHARDDLEIILPAGVSARSARLLDAWLGRNGTGSQVRSYLQWSPPALDVRPDAAGTLIRVPATLRRNVFYIELDPQ